VIDEHALSVACAAAVAEARRSGGPRLVSYQVRLDRPDDPVELWDRMRARTDRTFFWSSAWTGRRTVAAGGVLDLTGHGPDRFGQVQRAWSALARAGQPVGPVVPSVVGGFAFCPAVPGERAPGLPDALLWLPGLQLTWDGPDDPPWLALNGLARPGTEPAALATELATTARRLLGGKAGSARSLPGPRSVHEFPSSRSWQWLVGKAVDEIRQGSFEKVVFARRVEVRADDGFDLAAALRHFLAGSRDQTVFATGMHGQVFLGATPEYLLQVAGDRVRTLSLAGSARRGATPAEDAALERELRGAKNAHEHAVVTARLVSVLREHCADLRVEPGPTVLKLQHIQHLCTRLDARLAGRGLLELVATLHPTPALGGHPKDPALRWLAEHEPLDRGWFAAPVGWLDLSGHGEFAVAIRSALVSGRTASVYAGCGIVADSDPAAEYRESQVKMRTMLTALGAQGVQGAQIAQGAQDAAEMPAA
jgi:isochorismate synthase